MPGNGGGINVLVSIVRVELEPWARPEWQASGGNLLTGAALSIVAQWLVDGTSAQWGVLPPEIAVLPAPFFAALKQRGIHTTISETMTVT